VERGTLLVKVIKKINRDFGNTWSWARSAKQVVLSVTYPRRTPLPYLHAALNIVPIRDFIYHLTDNFFGSCPAHPNPLIISIGNYTLADLRRQYTKYTHKRPKHILL
jgi:hypothetical protein